MRLKISFQDSQDLFNYLDVDKDGNVGYDEFTLLLEERWRGIDPIETKQANAAQKVFVNPMDPS